MQPLRDRVVAVLPSLLLALTAAAPAALLAHEGHEHEESQAVSAPGPEASHPLPVPAASAAAPGLPARVIADPRRTLVVAAPQAGAVMAPAGGFPLAGRLLKAGEVIARLQPTVAQPLRRDLERQLADAHRDTGIGALQIDRYGIEVHNFDVALPTQTLQIITDYHAAQARQSQLEQSLSTSIDIAVPRGGRLLRVEAASGRQYAPGETLFVVQADDGLAIEARYVDTDLVAPEQAVALLDDGRQLPLRRLSSGYDSAQRAQVVRYAPLAHDPLLQVNQRLRLLFVQTLANTAVGAVH